MNKKRRYLIRYEDKDANEFLLDKYGWESIKEAEKVLRPILRSETRRKERGLPVLGFHWEIKIKYY